MGKVAAAAGIADVGIAADAGLAFGAADAADLATLGGVGELAAGDTLSFAAPEIATAGADLTGAIAPDLATVGGVGEVAAGDTLTGLGAETALAGDTAAIDAGLFGGTAGDLTSGAGLGLDAANTTFGSFNPDLFATNMADVAAGGTGPDIGAGSFGTGTTAGASAGPAGAPAGGVAGEAPIGSEATATESTTPIVKADEGIVESEPIQGSRFSDTFNQFHTTDQGASLPTDMANRVGVTPVQTQTTTLEQAFPGASQSITGAPPASFSDPLLPNSAPQPANIFTATPQQLNASQLAQMQSVGIPNTYTGDFTGSLGNVPPSDYAVQQAYAPLTGTTSPTAVADGAPVSADNPLSGEMIGGRAPAPSFYDVPPAAPTYPPAEAAPTPAATPATAATPPAATSTAATPATAAAPAAGGGVDALTGLRYGAAGVSLAAAGLNLANALNQPSYPALQPIAYPGSAYTAATPWQPTGPNQPGYQANPGSGGIRGGLAANRLTSGLVAGQTPQQLALSGIISPAKATQLQTDYNGITDAYAAQLGVDSRTLSPQVRQIIAAKALGQSGLGGA